MTTQYRLAELQKVLTQVTCPPTIAGAAELGVTVGPQRLATFVPPTVTHREADEALETANVIIISAAGAVGKSTLARELAAATMAPLWDLSIHGTVAQGSLFGMLLRAFGPNACPAILNSLGTGQFHVIVDALDEARMKTSDAGFDDFLDDIAKVGAGKGLAFVLLGRTQIAEWAAFVLQAKGCGVAILEIDPFDQASALDFIDRRVDASNGDGSVAKRKHPIPYAFARDAILDELRNALRVDQGAEQAGEAASFLGYAPVLDAVAQLLARDPNPHGIVQKLASEHSHPDGVEPVAILGRIIEAIMRRDALEKVQKNLRPSLKDAAIEAHWSDWDSLYTNDEQCARVVARVVGAEKPVRQDLPEPLRTKYEDSVESFLGEHAFIRDGSRFVNSVFASYAIARVVESGLEPVRRRALEWVTRAKPLPMLADFYWNFATSRSDAASVDIPAALLGILYDSLGAQTTPRRRLSLTLFRDEDSGDDGRDGVWDGEFAFFTAGEESRQDRGVHPFTVSADVERTLRFGRVLDHATIDVPAVVVFGSENGEFTLGPSVDLECDELRLVASSLIVKCASADGAEGEDVALRAGSATTSGDLRLRVIRGDKGREVGSLAVSWPGAEAYPWNQYRAPGTALPVHDRRLRLAYRRLRRILVIFRSHSKGALARYAPKVENRRTLRGPIGEALLARLLRHEILQRIGDFYYWSPTAGAHHLGVTWLQLRHGQAGEQLQAYLRAFIGDNTELFDD